MLLSSLLGLLAFSIHASASPVSRQFNAGSIALPTAETAIAPGSNFTFQYNPRADYGVSTFYYHVFLLDEAATASDPSFEPMNVFSTGYYFGRYDYPNYPAVPYAHNPCPPELTMPNFSQSPGGFASGMFGSNVKMQLIVIEEYGDGSPVGLGRKLGLASTEIIYNATTSA